MSMESGVCGVNAHRGPSPSSDLGSEKLAPHQSKAQACEPLNEK